MPPPDFPAAEPVGARGAESAVEPFGAFVAAGWSEPVLDAVLVGDEVSPVVVRCGCGGGSAAGTGAFEGSAGNALSTSAAKLSGAGDGGSGRAGFGGAT